MERVANRLEKFLSQSDQNKNVQQMCIHNSLNEK